MEIHKHYRLIFTLHTYDRAPLLKTAPTQLTECKAVELVLTSLHLYILESLVQEGALHAT